MIYTRIQFHKIAAFFYVLVFLLLFNLYYNINFQWFGVSLIVRVYLYVFSFYMIYIFSINNRSLVDSLRVPYIHKYGKKGELILQFENKIFPFFIIICVTVVYTFIDYIPEKSWPWNPVMKLISGRYSNVLIYSLFLYFIINVRRRPVLAILVFLIISFFYFAGDKMVYSHFPYGPGISVYRILKYATFFFVILYDFSEKTKDVIRTIGSSLLCALLLYAAIVSTYMGLYFLADKKYYLRRETGLALAKLGYPLALRDIERRMVLQKDSSFIDLVFAYGKYYNRIPELTDAEWNSLLFSGKAASADSVAEYFVIMNRQVSYDLMIGYIDERIKDRENVTEFPNLMNCAALSVKGHETEFMTRLDSSGKEMTLWGIQVLSKAGSPSAIPFLLRYIFDIDERVSKEAYAALRSITGLDPVRMFGFTENSPETLLVFKLYYQGSIAGISTAGVR